MQTRPTETLSETADMPAIWFRHVRNSLTYEDMHIIRDEVTEFMQIQGVPYAHIGDLLLALTEILSNLVKHPAHKADYLEVKARVTDDTIEMEVLDNSTPFADFDAKCKRALTLLHATITGAESGYGLGCILTVCRNPAYIPLEISPDRLNHFKITLNSVPALIPSILPQASGKKTVFLIDDDPISIQIHRQMLADVYEVIPFEKAEDALSAFPRQKPDLIISDLEMPGMDGIALRKALVETEGGNTTPFVFLSGHSDKENNPYISHLGIDDFLCKPISRERLHTVLTRLLRRSQQIHSSVQGQFHHDITELLRPTLPGAYGAWKFVTRNVVADAGGGDFILHQQTQTNLMTILVDVMGHGRQAKFFSYVYAGYLRSMFRMYAGTLDASHFLSYLSQSIDGDPLLESMLMTCQCFQFFPEGILKISSAGHPRPILLKKGGAELLDVMGPLPGLVGDSLYDMKSIRLEQGDKIIFMTDGFMEAFDRSEHAAKEILKRARDAPSSLAPELAEHLWRDFQRQQQKKVDHRDDATIIIAEYGGSE